MKKLSVILAMIFTLGIFCSVGTCAAEDDFDFVIYVGMGEGITKGIGKTPQTACETINEAMLRFPASAQRYNIVLVGDTVFTDTIKVSVPYLLISGKGLILPYIKSNNIYSDNMYNMFYVDRNSTLELGSKDSDIVIDGYAYKSEYEYKTATAPIPGGSYLLNYGTTILNDGITFQNMNTKVLTGGHYYWGATDAKTEYPCVSNLGTIEMNGGVFNNCGAPTTIQNLKDAVFNMNGGKIVSDEYKIKTAVSNSGEFNMNGGEIEYIKTAIKNNAKLNINGGKVSGKEYAITGDGSYTKSNEAIIEGKIKSTSDDASASASPEATIAPTIEPTAEPTPTPTPQPTLEPADENDTIPVYVKTDKVKFTDAYPFIDENNRTQLPVRAVADMLGCQVQWDGEKQLVTVIKDDITIYLTIGSNELVVNGTTTLMDTAARIENSRTYIPGRYIGEALGYTVDWSDGCVIIK